MASTQENARKLRYNLICTLVNVNANLSVFFKVTDFITKT
jgi:hypothetical protein